MLRQPPFRPLSRAALLLSAALVLSGCIFGEDEVAEERVAAPRPPAVFMAQNVQQFIGEVQDELNYRPSFDRFAANSMRQAIREIVAFATLSVSPESFMASVPTMPDIAAVDPEADESLRILHAEMGDKLPQGITLEDLQAKAVEMRSTAIEKYAEAARAAIALLDESREDVLTRQAQVQSVAGQVAFVRPTLEGWNKDGASLTGQVINQSRMALSEIGIEAVSPRLDDVPFSSDYRSDQEDDDPAHADIVIRFDPLLRAGETRRLQGHAVRLSGDPAADPDSLTGPVVIGITHVTLENGTTLTGKEYEPALNYLNKLESDIRSFVSTVPSAIAAVAEEAARPR